MTTRKRVSERRMLLFIGNGSGIIGYGMGRGADYDTAFCSAIKDAKRNLIILDIDSYNTCPNLLQAKFNDVRL